MTAEEYRNYLETDFDDVDLKELKDIRKIRIDRNQTKEKRIAQYLRQVGNPYLVCIGNVKVKIRFANNGVSFEDQYRRVADFLDELRQKPYEQVAIFAHGGILLNAQIYAGIIKPEEAFGALTPYGGIVKIELS